MPPTSPCHPTSARHDLGPVRLVATGSGPDDYTHITRSSLTCQPCGETDALALIGPDVVIRDVAAGGGALTLPAPLWHASSRWASFDAALGAASFVSSPAAEPGGADAGSGIEDRVFCLDAPERRVWSRAGTDASTLAWGSQTLRLARHVAGALEVYDADAAALRAIGTWRVERDYDRHVAFAEQDNLLLALGSQGVHLVDLRAPGGATGPQLDCDATDMSAANGRVALLRSAVCRDDGRGQPVGIAGGHWNFDHRVEVFDLRRAARPVWHVEAGVASGRTPPTLALSPDGDALAVCRAAGHAHDVHNFSTSDDIAATLTVTRGRADGYSRTDRIQVPRRYDALDLALGRPDMVPPPCWTADGRAVALASIAWPQAAPAEADAAPWSRTGARYLAQAWHAA